jgi:hypothetical protein
MREMRRTRRQISQVWTLNRNIWINFEHLLHPNGCGVISYERLMVWVLSEVQRHQHRILRTSNGGPHVTTSKSPSLNHFFIFEKNILLLIQGLSCFSEEMTAVDTKESLDGHLIRQNRDQRGDNGSYVGLLLQCWGRTPKAPISSWTYSWSESWKRKSVSRVEHSPFARMKIKVNNEMEYIFCPIDGYKQLSEWN